MARGEENSRAYSASVIVPTRDGASLIARILPSLAEQSAPAPYEVIVVDNGSRDSTPEVVRGASERWPHVRLVEEPRPGCGRARHAGALAARAPLLIFVDGDMLAEPGLVAEHLRMHDLLEGTCVIGNVVSAPGRHPFERMMAYIYDGPRTTLADREPTVEDCWPGNMSLSREVYFRLGGFSDSYADYGGEEWDFNLRMKQAAIKLRYAPGALTHHHFTARFRPRMRRSYINGQVFGYLSERNPGLRVGGFEPVRGRLRARAIEFACALAAALLEPFDRGKGVPCVPLAFVYDLGLRTAAGRGIADYAAGRVRLIGKSQPAAEEAAR